MKKFLIAGLGNPGVKYENTRHNIGYSVLDHLADRHEAPFSRVNFGLQATFSLKGRKFYLLKPDTFMNLSGKAVAFWLKKEKIPVENLLVVVDDLNLPFGTIRLRPGGSDGGHNGLRDIQERLSTNRFPRLRMGISNNFAKGRQIDYVLDTWGREEYQQLPGLLEKASKAIESFVLAGVNRTMNAYN